MFSWHIYGSRCRHFQLLPVTPSFLPRSQNSSTTASTSMTSPTKRGSSSETLGQKSKTARTTEPASIAPGLKVDQYLRLRHSRKFVSSQKHLKLSHICSESKTLLSTRGRNSVRVSCPVPETPCHVKHATGAKGLQQCSPHGLTCLSSPSGYLCGDTCLCCNGGRSSKKIGSEFLSGRKQEEGRKLSTSLTCRAGP